MYNFQPSKGEIFYIHGRKVKISKIFNDGEVGISPSVDGIVAMSVRNLYQIARVPEDSRWAPYGARKVTNPRHGVRANPTDLHPAKILVDGKGKVRVFVSPSVKARVNPKLK